MTPMATIQRRCRRRRPGSTAAFMAARWCCRTRGSLALPIPCGPHASPAGRMTGTPGGHCRPLWLPGGGVYKARDAFQLLQAAGPPARVLHVDEPDVAVADHERRGAERANARG